MASGTLAAPGEKYGPCKEACKHKDCAAIRAMAESLCLGCEKPIGYSTAFYKIQVGDWPTDRTLSGYAHEICTEEVKK